MGSEHSSLERFGERWAEAADAEQPRLDAQRGRDRLVASHQALRGRDLRRAGRRWRWIAAATLMVGFAIGFWVRSFSIHTFTIDARPAAAGAQVETQAVEQVLLFSGGNRITLAPDSQLHVREVDGQGALVDLGRGSVTVDVQRRAGARWQVTAGPFAVRVVGTAFDVVWRPETQRFSVTVQRGTVWVDGPMLGPGRSLDAGTRCRVDLKRSHLDVEPASEPLASDVPNAVAAPEDGSRTAPPPDQASHAGARLEAAIAEPRPRANEPRTAGPAHRTSWQELERSGQFEAAVAQAERSGLESIYDSADAPDLMSLARAARFVGRHDVSQRALTACRQRFVGSKDAAMAAYLLGRNAPPAEAVRWFSTYLSEAPGGAWAREAAGRLIEAHRAAGNAAAARDAARQYLLRYPTGPHAEFAKRVREE
jgi:transmembrane sensor